MELVVGTRKWSSWSLRPWLAARRSGLAFDVTVAPLREAARSTAAIRAAGSPSGLVPVLRDGDLIVWDSLAICEYLAEKAPSAGLWPAEAGLRAQARAATAEMHAGFAALRAACPMDLARAPDPASLTEGARADVRRIVELWTGLRAAARGEGPYLLGAWSIADAFYTPVATRFRTYGVDLAAHGDAGAAATYADTLLQDPDFRLWEAAAREEA